MRSSCTEPRPAHKPRAAAVGFGWRWQGKEERVAAVFCVEETVTNAACLPACRFQSKSHLIYSETVRERGERSRSFHPTFFFLLLLPFLPHWHLAKFPVVDLKQCSISKHLGLFPQGTALVPERERRTGTLNGMDPLEFWLSLELFQTVN